MKLNLYRISHGTERGYVTLYGVEIRGARRALIARAEGRPADVARLLPALRYAAKALPNPAARLYAARLIWSWNLWRAGKAS